MTPSPYAKKTEETARKWRALLQRRRQHLTELYRNGRYKKYFTEESLLQQMRGAAKAVEEWDALVARGEADSPIEQALNTLARGKAA
jgi:uncharacterized repeat protein (TIGR03809 family)